ncbi:FadR/GntR family transcriptional regulator [Pseudooceanicola spongiae]|uniref:FCD domain-containing protein n=1 Tax=Pseudooceanicola spongiae TaxID=2613965 RepID=A0A7L9WLN1_9RHOB|nr:FadR/GntR family transcriptional regulator [Pseudooceanicola spongiae]QOL80852.1 FCD domain-containing protein [Pseudooceanicola spongiae]
MEPPSNKDPVTQTIARQLQEMIRSGALAKDQKIPPQRALSEQLGVSRASLREALLTLETLGLVKTYPARGTFVLGTQAKPAATEPWRFVSQYSILDVFQSRLLIEGELCRLACPLVTPEVANALEQANRDFEGAWRDGDLVSHVEADLAFHALIAETCPNEMMKSLYRSVREMLTESQRVPIPNTAVARMEASIQEHHVILQALTQNTPDAAAEAMRAHVRNTAACAGYIV